ncbi:hypothetical protein CAT7_07923 [Carnobacterium sp. AT7]|nr:hypothetical protein CAT7_07923 [Carnobacterium sp. AT7]
MKFEDDENNLYEIAFRMGNFKAI